jgi:hypothetical protein
VTSDYRHSRSYMQKLIEAAAQPNHTSARSTFKTACSRYVPVLTRLTTVLPASPVPCVTQTLLTARLAMKRASSNAEICAELLQPSSKWFVQVPLFSRCCCRKQGGAVLAAMATACLIHMGWAYVPQIITQCRARKLGKVCVRIST